MVEVHDGEGVTEAAEMQKRFKQVNYALMRKWIDTAKLDRQVGRSGASGPVNPKCCAGNRGCTMSSRACVSAYRLADDNTASPPSDRRRPE